MTYTLFIARRDGLQCPLLIRSGHHFFLRNFKSGWKAERSLPMMPQRGMKAPAVVKENATALRRRSRGEAALNLQVSPIPPSALLGQTR